MSKMTGGDGKGGRMGMRGQPDRVRQSFSHGRTKSVVVETKKKFTLKKPGVTTAADIKAGLAAKASQVVSERAEAKMREAAAAAAEDADQAVLEADVALREAPVAIDEIRHEAPAEARGPEPDPEGEDAPAAQPEEDTQPEAVSPPEAESTSEMQAHPEPQAETEATAAPEAVAATQADSVVEPLAPAVAESTPATAEVSAPASPAPRPAKPAAEARSAERTESRGGKETRGRSGRQGPQAKPRSGKNQGRTLSSEELERRRKALKAAAVGEAERRQREAEEERRRIEELGRLRQEKEDQEREEREREEQRRREEEAKKVAAEQAAKKAEEEKARAEARAAKMSAGDAKRPEAGPRGATPGRRERETDSRNARKGDSRRSSGKLTISQALSGSEEGRQRSQAAMRRRQERERRKMGGQQAPREKVVREVKLPDAITVQELANRMAERVADVIKFLMTNGIMATVNQSIDTETAELVISEFGHKVVRVSDADVEDAIETTDDDEASLLPRAPVVTVMGHVDHGKTSLLDAIRNANVASGEAGGITQHIGAYQVRTSSGQLVTFLDTPGHAAFTSMRARGAQVTDIVILVVAADDSVMPQTIEAISHARAAGVPLIVAINKCDKPGADPEKVRVELLQHEVVVEKLSGDVLDIEVSATTGQGVPELLENIGLQAELLELRANPDRAAEGAVIEAKLDTGRGPIATVLVQRGTLRRGDVFVVGEQWGKVRALLSDQGERVEEAGPSVPVEVLGLNGTPEAGDTLNVVENEAKAREIADYRQRVSRESAAAAGARSSLDQLLAQAKADERVAELLVVVKGDVQGSVEAITQAMEKVGNEEVRVRVLHSGVGAITESDVTLAYASNAFIMGFNVRANTPAREAANQKSVEIRYYSVIYDLVDEVRAAAAGLLSPETKETFIGYAAIKQVFKVTGVGKVAGCEVTEGLARREAGVRLLRDDVVVHQGKLKTLKRFKDEVKEVRAGQECGMAFENYDDIREGDVIEIFETTQVERTLE